MKKATVPISMRRPAECAAGQSRNFNLDETSEEKFPEKKDAPYHLEHSSLPQQERDAKVGSLGKGLASLRKKFTRSHRPSAIPNAIKAVFNNGDAAAYAAASFTRSHRKTIPNTMKNAYAAAYAAASFARNQEEAISTSSRSAVSSAHNSLTRSLSDLTMSTWTQERKNRYDCADTFTAASDPFSGTTLTVLVPDNTAARNLEEFLSPDRSSLNFARNYIGGPGAAALSRKLAEVGTIRSLDLASTSIGNLGCEIIAAALMRNATLTDLNMENNDIGSEGGLQIGKALQINSTLISINISHNRIGDDGASEIGVSLMKNNTLTTLHVASNRIGAEGISKIRLALTHNKCLKELNISDNKFGDDECAEKVAHGLASSEALTSLDLGGTGIGFTSVASLCKALARNSMLDCLKLERNNIGNQSAAKISDMLAMNSTLTSLSLAFNSIASEGAEMIGHALELNSTLESLDLSRNEIGDCGGVQLESSLVKNQVLTKLDLDVNTITQRTNAEIGLILERNQTFLVQKRALTISGASFYVLTRDAVPDQSSDTSLEWNKENIRDAAVKDEHGMSLSLVHCALKTLLYKEEVFDDVQVDVAVPPPSCGLISACSKPHALKHLVDKSGIEKSSNLLHLAVSKYQTDTLSFCKFLVDEVGADFDTVTDRHGRTARTIALSSKRESIREWAMSVGTLFGRYRVESGPPVHESATSTVKLATDVVNLEAQEGSRDVALKFVTKYEHFVRELRTRLCNLDSTTPGECISRTGNRFNAEHAISIERFYDEHDKDGKRILCLVMPRAERSLDHIIRAERVAGYDLLKIKNFARDIARALEHIHSHPHNIVHGDVKPRNIVRIGGDFKLIDFDASVQIGERIGEDKRSSAYCPPELARVLFRVKENLEELQREREELISELEVSKKTKVRAFIEQEIKATEQKIAQHQAGNKDYPAAKRTFDVWSFGVVMYSLMTGKNLFKCDNDDNLDGEEEECQLVNWNHISEEQLKWVLRDCPGATSADVHAAKDFLRHCLQANPDDRPQTMTEVLNMSFFSSCHDSWTPAKRNCMNVLFSDPLVWADPDSGEMRPFLPRLEFSDEKELLTRCVRNAQKDIDLSFNAATCHRLEKLAAEKCGCLHFSGHGLESSGLAFEDGKGGAEFLGPSDLQTLLGSHSEPFKFVFVSACHSENIAWAFISAGVKHVVCCEQESELNHEAAVEFTSSFYDRLLQGLSIEVAFFSAKGVVSVRFSDGESMKFKLLPEDGLHDVTVFDADEVEGNTDSKVERSFIPSIPLHFVGRETAMHEVIYAILSGRRLITIVGEEGMGRTSVASAVGHYLYERQDDVLDNILYVQRNRAIGTLEQSLLTILHEQLHGSHTGAENFGKTAMAESICEVIGESRLLLVFDGIDGLEEEEALHIFLNFLFKKAKNVKVLLTASSRTVFTNSSVSETSFVLKPLDSNGAALQLFGKWCIHADTGDKRSDLLNLLSSELFTTTCEKTKQVSERIFSTIYDGSPSKIIRAAQDLSVDDYKSLFSDTLDIENAA